MRFQFCLDCPEHWPWSTRIAQHSRAGGMKFKVTLKRICEAREKINSLGERNGGAILVGHLTAFIGCRDTLAMASLDNFLISCADRAAGHLDSRGIVLPLALREVMLVELLAWGAIILIFALLAPPWIAVMLFAFSWSGRHEIRARWTNYSGDAGRDWTETLAAKYRDLAVRRRRGEFIRRHIFMMASALILGSVVMALARGASLGPDDLAIMGFMGFRLMRFYLECAIPIPPPPPQRETVPAGA